MKTFFEWYESQSFRRYIAFHGTKFPQIIEKFDVPTSFAAKVEMALRYVKQGRYYNENNFGRIYKVEITTAKPYVVSTQERMREMISKIVTDKKFKKEILMIFESAQEMYDRIFNMKFLPPGRGLLSAVG